ncbi:MAG: phosphoribosylaminoimidazolesuccinocarboxamide synthase [Phycisphaeraceae bacterium]|nr:phosphoribosylaminoimidazolesuccinocarboxamide synthase [Phycisphaeraceae bacterium]
MSSNHSPLLQTNLPLPGRRQGKVRDIYDVKLADGGPGLLIVASDRISAFDVVMPNGVPDKGVVLTQISRFWFERIHKQLSGKLSHHLLSTDPKDIPGLGAEDRQPLVGRVMIGRKTKVVPIECVVRGYLAGSGWKEYQQSQTVCGIKLPGGLRHCDKLPQPIFTPATKEESGHDENISFERACELVGADLMKTLRDGSLAIYQMGHDYAASRGIILADTKFEFGLPLGSGSAQPILIDEVLTPDSSRFWPAERYQPGQDQPSFDKQHVRNFLQELVDRGRWNKAAPGPELPEEIIQSTRQRYLEAYRLLTGRPLMM